MKQLSAILFLLILLFNLYGYRLLIDFWQTQEENKLQAHLITNNIDQQDLLSIKVPVSLPYYTNSADYEWVDGEVSMNGVIYKYVKKRIYNDSIEFVCIPDKGKMRLENARDEFYKLCNDLQTASQQNKKGATSPVKPVIPEYCQELCFPTIKLLLPEKIDHSGEISFFIAHITKTPLSEPPEVVHT